MATKTAQTADDSALVFDIALSDTTLGNMVKRRAADSTSHWEKLYGLKKLREENIKTYTSERVRKAARDDRFEDIFSDNKIFTSIRTILPFITSNMTQPEVVPADDNSEALKFARDFEKILVEVGENAYARDKGKLAMQDLLKGQRLGVLKWVFNPSKNKLELEHCTPGSIVVGRRSRLREEPDFVQHLQERTIGRLVQQFPDKKDAIYKAYDIEKAVPSQLEKVVNITENWIFIEDEDVTKLAVVFMTDTGEVLGKMSDPNWIDGGDNLIDEHMMPFIFYNFLNDGSGYIDDTSFLEQAEFNQKNYDKRGQTIAENAAYAGIGVPVFGKGAIKEETAAKVHFNPTQRIMLDIEDVGKGFTTWTGGQLQPFVMEDKLDMKNSVLDVFGTNSIQQGQQSGNKTAQQDILLRNQAEGRQQELIDCVDNAMSRFYLIEAQMIYRYFDDIQYYNFLGDDGQFEHLAISQARIAKNLNIKIKIKSGTSMPVDRSQKIAQALELAKLQRIGTLRLYKELGLEKPEEAYKEYLREKVLPFADLGEMDKEIFNREADEDLQLVIAGKTPKQREDITDDYLIHLQEYLLTQQYEQLKVKEQQQVSVFIAEVIAQAKRKAMKMSLMQPILPNATGQMPPIRPKISLSGNAMQPDVLAQVVQSAGYKPSQLTNAEMAAGLLTPPMIRETLTGNPLGQPQQPAAPAPVQQ